TPPAIPAPRASRVGGDPGSCDAARGSSFRRTGGRRWLWLSCAARAALSRAAVRSPGRRVALLGRHVGDLDREWAAQRLAARDPQRRVLAERNTGVGLHQGLAARAEPDVGDEVRWDRIAR